MNIGLFDIRFILKSQSTSPKYYIGVRKLKQAIYRRLSMLCTFPGGKINLTRNVVKFCYVNRNSSEAMILAVMNAIFAIARIIASLDFISAVHI